MTSVLGEAGWVLGEAGSVHGEAGSVLGVDGCRAGWVGVVVDVALTAAPRVAFAPTLAELAAAVGPVAAVGVDIPIGLPESGTRPADLLARRALGPKWPSIFLTPVRAAVDAPTYAEANTISRALTGSGLSRQAYALRAKILDAAAWIATDVPVPVLEVHPELSFVYLAGFAVYLAGFAVHGAGLAVHGAGLAVHGAGAAPSVVPLPSKRTWAGAQERMRLLRGAGIAIDEALGSAGRSAGVDDVLDAAVVAWTATRVVAGSACSFPSPPDRDASGREVAIWA